MNRRAPLTLLLVTSLVAAAPRPAAAEELEPHRTRTTSIVIGGGVIYAASEFLFKKQLAPASCRWCDDSLNGVDSGVRDALKWDAVGTPRAVSDIGLLVTPAATLSLLGWAAHRDDAFSQFDDDVLIVMEGTMLAMVVNQSVKFLVARQRPFVRALPDDQKGTSDKPEDENLSFFSGHTTWTFSLAVGAGTVASMRGYDGAPWVWAGGLTLAAATSYLRIAGDKHYFTDVMTGLVIGSAFGYLVPTLLHKKSGGGGGAESASLTGEPTRGGAMLGLAWVW